MTNILTCSVVPSNNSSATIKNCFPTRYILILKSLEFFYLVRILRDCRHSNTHNPKYFKYAVDIIAGFDDYRWRKHPILIHKLHILLYYFKKKIHLLQWWRVTPRAGVHTSWQYSSEYGMMPILFQRKIHTKKNISPSHLSQTS